VFGVHRHKHHIHADNRHPRCEAELTDPTGPCVECPAGAFPLSSAPCDRCVRLVSVAGGRRLRKRLAELGLNPGSIVRVVQSYGGGPLILAVKEDTRMAIGRGMAQKIMVTDDGSMEATA